MQDQHNERAASRRRWPSVMLGVFSSLLMLMLLHDRGQSLWPESWQIASIPALLAAIGLHVPYAILRALRLAALWRPRPGDRMDFTHVSWFLGSAWVSYFWLNVLPLRLGEFSRPYLLVRKTGGSLRDPAAWASALGATLAERIADLALILALFFTWLSTSSLMGKVGVGMVETLLAVILGIAVVLVLGLGTRRRWIHSNIGSRVGAWMHRLFRGLMALWRGEHRIAFWMGTFLYWGVTVLQLQLAARAFGVELTWIAAGGVVSAVALAIQLPAGPGQLGSYQLGAWSALEIIQPENAHSESLVSFVTFMWLLQNGAGAVFAGIGWAGLRRFSRQDDFVLR